MFYSLDAIASSSGTHITFLNNQILTKYSLFCYHIQMNRILRPESHDVYKDCDDGEGAKGYAGPSFKRNV